MELKDSSPKPESVAPSDCTSDPEEKEVTDDDDDRNHKHRRREAHSQSLERDVSEPVLSRSFRKRPKPYGNHNPFRVNENLAFGTQKNYSDPTAEKDFYPKFDRRHPGMTSVSRTPLDMSQRLWENQPFPGGPGAGRGRGRESGFLNQRESRFSSIDVSSQMVQHGPIHPSIYSGHGLPNVSNAPSASWNAFGLIPAVPNGGLDMLHPMGLQGKLPRQRCRDFEERGFCLRGDMCPMEHGVNRIVIEDVQSLSQFNLPVIGAPAGSGSLHSVNPSTTSMNKSIPGKVRKSLVADDGSPLDGAYPGPGCTSAADLYDPDQPLWNDGGLASSNALLTIQSSNIDESKPLFCDTSAHHHVNSDCPDGTTRTSVSSQGASSSVWGRVSGSKNRFDMKEKTHSTGNRIISDNADLKALDASVKAHTDNMRHIRKSSQKALCTLFVNGIPHKSNKKEYLLAHFKKFGEVIDIYIPLNTERAFVQFSKREEAEAALKAPDAVMGNRFIKLWWANRDSIRNDITTSGNGVIVTPHRQASASAPSHPGVTDKGKYVHNGDASKATFEVSPPDQPKLVVANGIPKVPLPPKQKKLENLEHLKEELRKKQEMLDQKRNDFKRQLNKLEKQASGLKGEVVTEKAAKRPKIGTASDVANLASQSSDADLGMASSHEETTSDKNGELVNAVSQSLKGSKTMSPQESSGAKQAIQPSVPVNRYKLDNRPTAFRVIPPLPAALANVSVLKEHFLPYGELSVVDLEYVQANDSSQQEARITFTTRSAAESAFANGKVWKDNNLKFLWLTPSNSSNTAGSSEHSLSTPKEPLDTNDCSEEKCVSSVNQEANVVSEDEHRSCETKNGVEEHMEMEPVEDLNYAKQSPKSNDC